MTCANENFPTVIFTVTNAVAAPFKIAVKGCDRWELEKLIFARKASCTSIDQPCLPWSAYVSKVRSFGTDFETILQRHEGSFSGIHARFVLHSVVALFKKKGA